MVSENLFPKTCVRIIWDFAAGRNPTRASVVGGEMQNMSLQVNYNA